MKHLRVQDLKDACVSLGFVIHTNIYPEDLEKTHVQGIINPIFYPKEEECVTSCLEVDLRHELTGGSDPDGTPGEGVE